MTKKNFDLIAHVLKVGMTMPNYSQKELEVVKDMVGYFENSLYETNPRFDSEKFRKSCGVNDDIRYTVGMIPNGQEIK